MKTLLGYWSVQEFWTLKHCHCYIYKERCVLLFKVNLTRINFQSLTYSGVHLFVSLSKSALKLERSLTTIREMRELARDMCGH